MNALIKNAVLLALLAGGLSACGSSSDTPNTGPVVTPPAPKVEDGFGANFGTAYRGDPNAIAKDPVPGDIVPLDLTKDAVQI
jgi:hypothetical protein